MRWMHQYPANKYGFSERELTFTFGVNSRSRSLYAIARPSVCRLYICLSSVTLMRPTQAVQIFGNISTVSDIH